MVHESWFGVVGWHHHFGPASGSDPKISDPLGRYCMAVFTGGVNIGPYEAARHIAGVSARELSMSATGTST